MKFTIAPAPGGRWAAGYIIPGTGVLTVLVDCPTRSGALAESSALQDQHDRDNPKQPSDPLDRPVVSGFYTDVDAE